MLVCLGAAPTVAQDLSHRQSTLAVNVTNHLGEPLPGAAIKVEMLDHDFRFGTAVVYGELYPGNPEYSLAGLDALQTYFNSVTFGNYMKWTYTENRPYATTRRTISDVLALRAFGSERNFRLRGHVTVWGASYQLPADLRAMTDPAAVRTRIRNHVTAYHTGLKGAGVDTYDLYNEHFHEREFIIAKAVPGGSIAEQAAEVAEWFKLAAAADPDTQLYINEYNILNFWNENDVDVIAYKTFVDAVRDAGGPVSGIGLQGHMDRYITQAQIKRRLDLLAAPMPPTARHPAGLPGVRLEVTELDINTRGWTSATPAQQAEVVAHVLDAAFAHPSVDGVTMWGMRDSLHWRENAVMFDDSNPNNWVVKPSGQVWIDRVKGRWWTNLTGTSGDQGSFSGRVFKGRHRITVTHQGTAQTFERNLSADQTLAVTFDTRPPDLTGSYLSNLSVRAPLAAGQPLRLGFVVRGGDKPVLARVAGPALAAFGLNDFMPDPRLVIQREGNIVATNDDWDAAAILPAARAVGAFDFTVGSKDAATLATVNGANTVEIQGNPGGLIVSEIYDAQGSANGPRLVNLSTLSLAGTGANTLTAGFTVNGTGKARLLIRGVGPELARSYGVTNVLADPRLTVYAGSTVIATNDNWDAGLMGVMADLGAFALPAGSKDAALLLVVDAGGQGYTVQVSGADGGTGNALIEIYEAR